MLAGYEIEVDLLRSTAGRLGLISWVISAAMGAILVTALWASECCRSITPSRLV